MGNPVWESEVSQAPGLPLHKEGRASRLLSTWQVGRHDL